MVEFVGLVKINVEKGTDLAVRDMVSSDPYVMLSLGHQVCHLSSSSSFCHYYYSFGGVA